MIEAEKPEFVAILTGLAAVKPGGKLTKESLLVWWLSLAEWSLSDFKIAAAHLSRTCEFMPNPYHFDQLRKAGRLTVGEAWDRARKASGSAIQCGQVTHNGTCGDPVIDTAVRAIGGYGVIAMCETSKLPFLERRFAEHLESIQDAHDTREALPQIASPEPALRLVRGRQA